MSKNDYTISMNKNIWIIITVLAVLMVAVFICLMLGIGVALPGLITTQVGYPLDHSTPSVPGGDMSAGGHIFVHNYPMPANGWITGVKYLNDYEPEIDEITESAIILVLRHETTGFRVIGHAELPLDDNPARTKGISTYIFPQPIKVAQGDLLAHYQPIGQSTGPIPLNIEGSAAPGLSVGKAGFSLDDILLGSLISDAGFSGLRDYYITAIFHR